MLVGGMFCVVLQGYSLIPTAPFWKTRGVTLVRTKEEEEKRSCPKLTQHVIQHVCNDMMTVLFDNRLKQHKYSSKVDDPNEAGSSDAEDASGDEASSKNSPK